MKLFMIWEPRKPPKRRTTTYGLRTFSYSGSKLWNLLASEYSEVNDIDYERLKFLIKYWTGPNHDSAQGHFLWSTFCVLHVCFRNHFFINLIAHTLTARDCQFANFFRRWWHRKLSLRQIPVSPVMAGLSSWRPLVFRVRHCTVYTCTIYMSYTSLLANVICCTFDVK